MSSINVIIAFIIALKLSMKVYNFILNNNKNMLRRND